jgi:[ribosomal protein S5]-alanine N-acetyltransferase
MPATLTTARLRLTPVGDHDPAPLHAHWNDPRVARFLWDAQPVATATVADLIARSHHTFQTNGWGLWALRPGPDPQAGIAPIGVCGLCPFDHGPGVELLYSLAPTHWSQGLATEAATAVLTHAFETVGLEEVVATTDDANEPSLRLLTRLGAIPTAQVRVGPTPTPASPSLAPSGPSQGGCKQVRPPNPPRGRGPEVPERRRCSPACSIRPPDAGRPSRAGVAARSPELVTAFRDRLDGAVPAACGSEADLVVGG